jgi:hypothetical protein
LPTSLSFDVVILGAGAAGLMCAIEAGKRGRRVAVVERAPQVGKKILISGGGRCNFTNLHCKPENFLSANPHFAKSALARYTPTDFIALVQKHRIPYHEKTLGQLFCDGSAREIVNMLLKECSAAQVQVFTETTVQDVRRTSHFVVSSKAAEFHCESLVVATGGLSIPKIGATAFGYDLAGQFGLKLRECRPALVPLTWAPDDLRHYGELAGVSMEVIASNGQTQFREKMLLTHRGLSGPAILQISSYWRPNQCLVLDVAPGREVFASLRRHTSSRDLGLATTTLRSVLPVRFAERWLSLHAPTRWTNASLDDLERRLHRWEVHPSGTEGFEKAEVTAGGVDTDELSAKTMESRKLPGLFFIGEAVDVTGNLGGFNFQWAWASGFAAGQAV